MSFLSVLQKVEHGIMLGAKMAAPICEVALPFVPGGSIAATVLQAIVMAEGVVQTPGTGPVKKQAVTALVTAAHPGIDQAKLGAAVDGIVAALNTLSTATA